MGGAKAAYKKIIDQGLDLPTEGQVAAELWDHFIQIGHRDSRFLTEVASYAVKLRQRTGRVRCGLYSDIIGHELKRSVPTAFPLHEFLKAHIPPDRIDYEKLFRLSLLLGQSASLEFEKIYEDHPVPKMYSTIIPGLCKQGMRTEATRWHYLFMKKGDLPENFRACKPLLEYYAHIKNSKEVENLVRSLAQSQVWFEKSMDKFVQKEKIVSREILNRVIGRSAWYCSIEAVRWVLCPGSLLRASFLLTQSSAVYRLWALNP